MTHCKCWHSSIQSTTIMPANWINHLTYWFIQSHWMWPVPNPEMAMWALTWHIGFNKTTRWSNSPVKHSVTYMPCQSLTLQFSTLVPSRDTRLRTIPTSTRCQGRQSCDIPPKPSTTIDITTKTAKAFTCNHEWPHSQCMMVLNSQQQTTKPDDDSQWSFTCVLCDSKEITLLNSPCTTESDIRWCCWQMITHHAAPN